MVALVMLFIDSFIESNGMCPLCGEECGEKDIKLMTEDQVQARLANQ